MWKCAARPSSPKRSFSQRHFLNPVRERLDAGEQGRHSKRRFLERAFGWIYWFYPSSTYFPSIKHRKRLYFTEDVTFRLRLKGKACWGQRTTSRVGLVAPLGAHYHPVSCSPEKQNQQEMYIYIAIDIYTPINSLSRERETDPLCTVCSVMFDSLRPHGLKPPGPPVHGIFQASILEWIAVSFSKTDYRQ